MSHPYRSCVQATNPKQSDTGTFHDHFDLELVSLFRGFQQFQHQPPAYKAVSTLIIWDRLPDHPGKKMGSYRIAHFSNRRHDRKITLANDQVRLSGNILLDKSGDEAPVTVKV